MGDVSCRTAGILHTEGMICAHMLSLRYDEAPTYNPFFYAGQVHFHLVTQV
jgi:hypothetical protein